MYSTTCVRASVRAGRPRVRAGWSPGRKPKGSVHRSYAQMSAKFRSESHSSGAACISEQGNSLFVFLYITRSLLIAYARNVGYDGGTRVGRIERASTCTRTGGVRKVDRQIDRRDSRGTVRSGWRRDAYRERSQKSAVHLVSTPFLLLLVLSRLSRVRSGRAGPRIQRIALTGQMFLSRA